MHQGNFGETKESSLGKHLFLSINLWVTLYCVLGSVDVSMCYLQLQVCPSYPANIQVTHLGTVLDALC